MRALGSWQQGPWQRQELLKRPCHIDSQIPHGLDTLFVLHDLTRISAHSYVPIRGTNYYHLAYEEEIVYGAEHMGCASAPCSHHCCADFTFEHVAICPGNHAAAFDEGLGVGREVCKVCGRADDDAVGLQHLFDVFVHGIIHPRTAPVLVCKTFVAGDAAGKGRATQLDHLGLDAFPLQFFKDDFDHLGCVATLSCTTVKGDYFHGCISFLNIVIEF